MTVRIRYFIGIFPLFLIVAVFLAVFGYRLQVQELLRGYTDEARGVAVSVAALLTAGDWEQESRAFLAGDSPGLKMQRLLDWRIARHVSVYYLPGERLAFSWPRSPEQRWPTLPADWPTRESEPQLDFIPESNRWVIHAYARVFREEEEAFGVVAVQTDAQSFVSAREALFRQAVWLAASILALGILVTYFMARFLSRQIRSLNKGISTTIHTGLTTPGDRDEPQRESRIREITDLQQTVEVLLTVYEEEFKRIKQSLVESEQFRDEKHLAITYAKHFFPERREEVPPLRISCGRAGQFDPRTFGGFCPDANGAKGFLGRFPATKSPLEAVVTANALETFFLREQDSLADLAEGWTLLNRLFAPESLTLWSIAKGTLHLQQGHDGETPHGGAETLEPGGRLILDTLPKGRGEILRRFVTTYPAGEAPQLLSQLQLLVPLTESGVIILLEHEINRKPH